MGNDDLVEEEGVVGCATSPISWVVVQLTYVVAGALGTILDQAGSSGSPAVQENVPTGFEPPTPVRVQTEDPNAGRVINSDLNRSWVPSRPWER